jgi:nicotinate phosphoribosyltransferase
VDTYDTPRGVEAALAAAGPALGGIRIDSGDLDALARHARTVLDDAGAHDARIVVSGDLDEFMIAQLASAPVDAFGVGTSLVTGSGAPTAGFVYKLVARATAAGGEFTPVAKGGGTKATVGRWKVASRELTDGTATRELLRPAGTSRPSGSRPLQVPVVEGGVRLGGNDLTAARDHHRRAMAELPAHAHELTPGDPCIPSARLDG